MNFISTPFGRQNLHRVVCPTFTHASKVCRLFSTSDAKNLAGFVGG
jgi:hypothetical protein